jgi:hypothetical protein
VSATYPRLLLGGGSGTFTLAPDQNQSYNTQAPAGSVAVADFNGDGRPDLSVLESSSSNPLGQSFVLFDVGSDRFSIPFAINAGPALISDVNGDGRDDLVFNSNAGITVMLGQANSTFATVNTALPTGGTVEALGDLNNDGIPDLVTFENSGIRLWLGRGDGTFSHSSLVPFPAGFYAQSAIIRDLDADGNADIIVVPNPNAAAPIGPLLVLYGNGDGTFQPPSFVALSHRYGLLAIADVNRDNKPDLVLSDGAGIAVITNLGNRSFSPEDHYVAGKGISQMNVVDVNSDGFPDIVAANSGGTTVTVLLNQPNGKPLDGAPSIGAFTVTPAPSNYSQPVTLKIVMSASAGAAIPTGSATFYVDGTYITDVPLVAGAASYLYTQSLTTGTHTFVAAYNGDITYSAESFAALQTINPPVYATQTALTASPKTVLASQTVRLTASVTSSVTVPAGVVTFMDGTNSLGGQQVDSTGVAQLDTATLTAGTHQISAVYQGYQEPFNLQAIYQPSTSLPVIVTVNTVMTSTGISASTSSPTSGAVVTFTASVTSGSASPFGGASFYDSGTLLGTVSLVSGTASFSTASLSMGSHRITAVFNKNATFRSSTSPALNITVAAASAALAKSLVLVNLQNNSGAAVLSAMVANPVVAGKVSFLESGRILGTTSTDALGRALLPVSMLSSGSHNFSASFAGSSQFAPAVSPESMEQWPPSGPGFSIEFSSESLSVGLSRSEQLPIKIVPIGNFQESVRFSCLSELPDGYSCEFSPPALTGGGITHLSLQQQGTPRGKSSTRMAGYGIAVGLFALLLAFKEGRRPRCLVILLVTVNLLSLGCGDPVRQPQAQVISVRATSGAGSGLIIHSAQVLIKVYPEP